MNPLALLVGIQNGAATVKNSMEVPRKVKNRATLRSKYPRYWVFTQKTQKTPIQRDTCTPMFVAALSTIAKLWKQHSVNR